MKRQPCAVTSPKNRFSVFEFGEEDERVERTSGNLIGRLGQSRRRKHSRSSPSTKYKSLACLTGTLKEKNRKGTVDVGNAPVEINIDGGSKFQSDSICNKLVDIDGDSRGNGVIHPKRSLIKSSPFEEDAVGVGISQADTLVLSNASYFKSDQVGKISEDDGQIKLNLLTSVSTALVNKVNSQQKVVEHGSLRHELDPLNKEVFIFPDFFLFGDLYCTESRLIFSESCIRVEASTVNGTKGKFNARYPIIDIIKVESQWCRRVETAIVNLHLKSKVSQGVGYENETSGLTFDHTSTCINKLQFSICDPDWCERQEAIKRVSFRYRDIWSDTYGACRENDENHGQRNVAISKPYISGLDQTFEEIIFPKGDPDAVSISKRDVELLSPETFINDTIIDFYIKYLKSRLLPENRPRFHFFNSFFFRKLADLDKDPFSSHEGREAFERVRKWTRKVNIFDKDYVFIPVNYSHHWSLIVICHPGEVAHFRDEGCEKLLRVPCILHMDSMKGSHRGLKNLVQSYLYEEWKARHEEMEDDALLKFLHLRFISLELPQQQNSYDCGLFLLHYVELFLEEAPVNFSPFNITKFSHFLNRKWFPVEEASLKRSYIQKLIYQILEDQCQKVPPSESSNRNNSFQFAATRQEVETEILEKRSRTPNAWKSYSFSSKADMRIGTSLSAITSPRVIQQQFRVGSARPFPGGIQWQTGASHWRSLSSSVEEAEGNSQQVTNLSPDREDNWQIPRLSTECSTASQLDSGFNHLKTSQNQISTRIEEKLNENLSCETCTVESQKSSEIGVEEYYMFVECERLHNPIETDRQECSSTSSEVLATCVVADSQETNCTEDANQEEDSCSSIFRKGDNKNNRPDSSV